MLCVRWIIAFLNGLDQSTVEVIHTKVARVAQKLTYKEHLKEFGTLIQSE